MRQKVLCVVLFVIGLGGGVAHADPSASCQDLSNPEAALAACAEAIESGTWKGADLAWAYNNQGLAHAARGDYLRAISSYSEALSLKPDFAPAYSNRGNAHAELGDMLKALADHEQAVSFDPGFVAARHNLAVDREQLGQYRAALQDYRAVIKMAPGHRGSHVGLATASCKLGRVKASAEARLRAIEKGVLDPTDMQVLLQTEGFYRGPIDGIFGKGSRAALWAWTRKGCLAGA